MKLNEFLPVGSVVLLKNAQKKLIIIGYMPVRQGESGETVVFDYLGTVYPEGFLRQELSVLFNHNMIEKVIFSGYHDEERVVFVDAIQKIMDKTDQVIGETGM